MFQTNKEMVAQAALGLFRRYEVFFSKTLHDYHEKRIYEVVIVDIDDPISIIDWEQAAKNRAQGMLALTDKGNYIIVDIKRLY